MARSISPAAVGHVGLTWPLTGVIAGCAFQLQQATLWSSSSYLAVAVLALLGLISGVRILRRRAGHDTAAAVLLSLGMLAIGFSVTGWRAAEQSSHALRPELEGRDMELTGVVTDMPQYRQTGVRFGFQVEDASLNGEPVAVPSHLSLSWYFGQPSDWVQTDTQAEGDTASAQTAAGSAAVSSPVRAGERWRLRARLKAPHGALNPFGYDSELRYWERGIQAVGYVRQGPKETPPERLTQTWRHPIELARQQVRERLSQQGLAPRPAGVIAALVLGDQAAIEQTDWLIFRKAGVAHLMSISGLHITMFAWLAMRLLALVWRQSTRLCRWWPAPQAALFGGLVLAFAYALFSGWEVPAQRTVLMLGVVSALRGLGLRWPWPQVWLLACAVVVMVDPWALLQAGFWLSFVAVGILFASGPGPAQQAHVGSLTYLGRMVREQALIGLALAPLSLLLFGQFSLIGFVANLVAIPWVTLLVTPLSMLGVLWAPLWAMAAGAVDLLVSLLSAFTAWPWALFSRAQAPIVLGVLAVLGGAFVALRLPWSMRALALLPLLPVMFWQPRPVPMGEFELIAADIGQGNAVLVRTQHHALLYDTGASFGPDHDAGQAILLPLMRALALELDRVVLSHQDSDHTGGAAAVLLAHDKADAWGSVDTDHPLQRVRQIQPCGLGQRWQWDGVTFEFLWPQQGEPPNKAKPNSRSCVLRIASAQASVLLTGDIEKKQERQLLDGHKTSLRADVLLVPHHGSKTSSSDAFLDAVAPTTALLQAGYRNRYGHPAPEVSQRYLARGIDFRSTVACGAITWQSWSPGAVSCPRVQQPRYWRHQAPS